MGHNSTTRLPVVAIVASAGGLAPILEILTSLPADFPAAVLVMQHTTPGRSRLTFILERRSTMPTKEAEEGDRLELGHIYVAPPDEQTLITRDATISLGPSDREHHRGPSANRLFESLAASEATHAIVVVLSGMGHDGSAGVEAIKANDGTIIAQDEATSEFFSMPQSAIETGYVDFILPVQDIAATLLSLLESERQK